MSYGGSWDHSKVKDYAVLHNTAPEDEEPAFPKGSPEDIEGTWQWNITKGLAIRMSSIGVPRITETNVELVFLRCRQVDEVLGCVLTQYIKNPTDGGNKMRDYHITIEDIERRVGLWATTDKKLSDAGFKKRIADEIEHKVKRATSTERSKYKARQVILALKAGDDWTTACDSAARTLGLDPDNYRAADNENWPEDMRLKVIFDTGQSILDHYDNAKKVTA